MRPLFDNGNQQVKPLSTRELRTDSVLVAEDDPVSRSILQSWLKKWNFTVTIVEDGVQAWDALQKKDPPSLLILDWMMPGMDGIDVCRKVRERNTSPSPYILLLTSKDEKSDLVHGLDAGADEYLTKPFDVNELRARLNVGTRLLELQHALLRKEEQLRFQASHDTLTGLWNRGAIIDFLAREADRSRRTSSTTGVLMLDIDHFKSVNDTHGHPAGDKVLKEVARRLEAGVRNYDWVGRYGGEEFLVILSNCSPEVVERCAERLRASVANTPVHVDGKKLEITISLGAALSQPSNWPSSDELLHNADEALYRAKKNGRNRVEITWEAKLLHDHETMEDIPLVNQAAGPADFMRRN